MLALLLLRPLDSDCTYTISSPGSVILGLDNHVSQLVIIINLSTYTFLSFSVSFSIYIYILYIHTIYIISYISLVNPDLSDFDTEK